MPSGAWDDIPAGKYLGERRLELEPEFLRRLQDSCDDHHPWYAGETPFGGPVAPALAGCHEPWRHPGWYPADLRGNLHLRQEWDLFRPMPAGASVRSRGLIVERYVRRDRYVIVNQVTLEAPDGSVHAIGRTHQSFLLNPDGGGDVVSRAREREEGRRIEPPAVAASALESLEGGWLDLTAGRCLDIADGLRNYHSDAEIARALGFPAVVVQGVFNCNLVSALMTERFGAGWYCGGQMRLSLVNVLWEGDRARARVALEQMEDERPRRRVRGQAWVEKVDGTITAIGAVSALIPGA